MNEIQVLVTGLAWMGQGIRSIETVLEELLQSAQDEILITTYTIGSASDRIFRNIEGALARGVKVVMLVNYFSKQYPDVKNRLRSFQDKYPHFHLYSFEEEKEQSDLHAKVLVIDRQRALVGSSNLSYSGMVANHELALLVIGEKVAEIARAIDLLIGSKYCREIK